MTRRPDDGRAGRRSIFWLSPAFLAHASNAATPDRHRAGTFRRENRGGLRPALTCPGRVRRSPLVTARPGRIS